MEKLRIGIVGLNRGASYIGIFNAIEGVEVTAICDINQDILDKTGGSLGIKDRHLDCEAMLEDGVDIAVIATPMHVPQAVSALKSNVHVLSEVPAAFTLDECQMLLSAVRKSRAKYMMAENYCYIKENVLIKNMVRQGLFGDIYFAEGEYVHDCKSIHHDGRGKPTWRYYWQVGRNGVTYGTHSLGPPLEWFNERVVKASCLGTGVHTDPEHMLEDTVLMLCKVNSGSLIKIRLDMLSNRPPNVAYYSLQGTKGCYEAPRGLGDAHKVWLMSDSQNYDWKPLRDYEGRYLPEGRLKSPDGAIKADRDYWLVRDFLDSIISDVTPPIDIYKALDFTVPGLISEESIRQGGKPLTVPDFREM